MTKNITILILLFSVTAFAQRKYKNADRLFDQMSYIEAAAAYESAIDRGDNSMDLLQKAGDAHYFNTNMVEANKWYDLLISQYGKEVDPEYIFRFAHTLEGIGNYKAARKWTKAFAKASTQDDQRIEDYAQRQQTLADVLAIPAQYELNNLAINTEYSDFGPAYYNKEELMQLEVKLLVTGNSQKSLIPNITKQHLRLQKMKNVFILHVTIMMEI